MGLDRENRSGEKEKGASVPRLTVRYTSNLAKNRVGVFRPNERLRGLVVMVEILADRPHKRGDALERPAAQPRARDLREPTLDEVEPRTARRRKVQVHARMTREPAPYRRTLVGARVVDDEMERQVRWRFAIEPLEKRDEFLRAVSCVTLANHHAVEHPQGGN